MYINGLFLRYKTLIKTETVILSGFYVDLRYTFFFDLIYGDMYYRPIHFLISIVVLCQFVIYNYLLAFNLQLFKI